MKPDKKDIYALFIALGIYLAFHIILLTIVLSLSLGILFTVWNYIKGESLRGSIFWIIIGVVLLPVEYYLYRLIKE